MLGRFDESEKLGEAGLLCLEPVIEFLSLIRLKLLIIESFEILAFLCFGGIDAIFWQFCGGTIREIVELTEFSTSFSPALPPLI